MRTALALVGLLITLALTACGGGQARPPASTVTSTSNSATSSSTPVDTSGAVAVAGAAIPGGGLSVDDARSSTLIGPLMVHGFAVLAGGRVLLCSVRAADGAGCEGSSLDVTGLTAGKAEALAAQGDISLLGEVRNGVLTVSATAQ